MDDYGTYAAIRSVSSVLTAICTTRAGGNFDVNGVWNTVSLETLPVSFSTKRINQFIDTALPGSINLNVPIMDGVACVQPFNTNLGFRKAGTPDDPVISGWFRPSGTSSMVESDQSYYYDNKRLFIPTASAALNVFFSIDASVNVELTNM